MDKTELTENQKNCLDKLEDMVAKVKQGEVNSVMVFGDKEGGPFNSETKSDEFYSNVAMWQSRQKAILTSYFIQLTNS